MDCLHKHMDDVGADCKDAVLATSKADGWLFQYPLWIFSPLPGHHGSEHGQGSGNTGSSGKRGMQRGLCCTRLCNRVARLCLQSILTGERQTGPGLLHDACVTTFEQPASKSSDDGSGPSEEKTLDSKLASLTTKAESQAAKSSGHLKPFVIFGTCRARLWSQ